MPVVVALHVFPPAIFAFIHGKRTYQVRGVLSFVAITWVIGFLIETLGVQTGFQFGRYYFTDLMGGKIGVVPCNAWTRLCRDGLLVMDIGACHCRMDAEFVTRVATRCDIRARSVHRGLMGLVFRPGVVNRVARVDMETEWGIFRRTDNKLRRLVLHRISDLSMFCALLAHRADHAC